MSFNKILPDCLSCRLKHVSKISDEVIPLCRYFASLPGRAHPVVWVSSTAVFGQKQTGLLDESVLPVPDHWRGILVKEAEDNISEIKVSDDDYKNDPRVIKSPMVGTVYLQPEPGANKFVNIGDSVKSGQTILIVEAMKTMNPIESSLQGKVIKILVENEQAVEFGQPLMLIG